MTESRSPPPTDGAGEPSRQRLTELVREHLGWLRAWLGARLSGYQRQEVDDLCQEVFLRALRGAAGLRDPSRFAPWLYRIANNVLNDFLRQKARKRREVLSLDSDVTDPRSHFTAAIDAGDELEQALQAVLALPRRYREPLLLRHSKNLSYAEVGEILGISENAVQVRIHRARQMLRRSLKLDEASVSKTDREENGPPRSVPGVKQAI